MLKKGFGFSQIFFFRFQKDLTEKGVRLRSTYLLMFLFCCVYFFFVILDALIQQCAGYCGCQTFSAVLILIFEDLAKAIFKLFPFWALSSLPLVLVALLQIVSLGRKDFFKNHGWVSSLTGGIIGVPVALGILFLVSLVLTVLMWFVTFFENGLFCSEDLVDYLRK